MHTDDMEILLPRLNQQSQPCRGLWVCHPKPVMNPFTYMRSEGDCVWQIPFEQATLRDRRFIGSKVVHRVMLIYQGLEASTQSASIRTGVNEMMTLLVKSRQWNFQCYRCTFQPAWPRSLGV